MNTIKKSDIDSLINQELTSQWTHITQEQINQFADCTLDHQFIHINPEKAQQTPFGSTIAHGFLSLSLLSHFWMETGFTLENTQMVINYGLDKVRFLNPVTVGSHVRGICKLVEYEQKDDHSILMKIQITVQIKGQDKPALIAQWLGLSILGKQ